MEPVTVTRGSGPLVLAVPHAGIWVPKPLHARLNPCAESLSDTDWHVDRLYSRLVPDATMVRANFHRYLIDANRDPEGHSLYPGQNTTGLCPVTDFDGNRLYREGEEPDEAEQAERRERFHSAYHGTLQAEIERVRAEHGIALVYDCHSIRSEIPYLFEGRLPDFNIGTNEGRTCAPELQAAMEEVCRSASGYSTVVNGRFKGGWTTRHYGRPDQGVHAVQMELAQSAYLQSEAPPFAYDEVKAERLRPVLKSVLDTLLARLRGLQPG